MGKKKCKKCECPAGEKWAVPTADFFSLLLALFIALYAIASVNKEKLKAVKEEFVKIYDYAPVADHINPVQEMVPDTKNPDPDANANPSGKAPIESGGSVLIGEQGMAESQAENQNINESVAKLQQDLKQASMGEGPMDQAVDGVLLKLPATVMFHGADATVNNEDTHLFIKRVSDIISALPPSVNISVRGYTDDQALPKGSAYRDNLELSSSRADTVVRELIRNGVDPARLSTAGFGSAHPVAANTNEDNRAKNRRVEFYMFVSNEKPLNPHTQNDILNALSQLKH
ncbi:MAG: flagellar motor protein MotB [Sulfuricurvum sp.]